MTYGRFWSTVTVIPYNLLAFHLFEACLYRGFVSLYAPLSLFLYVCQRYYFIWFTCGTWPSLKCQYHFWEQKDIHVWPLIYIISVHYINSCWLITVAETKPDRLVTPHDKCTGANDLWHTSNFVVWLSMYVHVRNLICCVIKKNYSISLGIGYMVFEMHRFLMI